eukprot:5539623-Prymnesium_polylepis.1
MAHCAGPGGRQAAQAQAAEPQACPCAEDARAGSLGRVRVTAPVGPKEVAHPLRAGMRYAEKRLLR